MENITLPAKNFHGLGEQRIEASRHWDITSENDAAIQATQRQYIAKLRQLHRVRSMSEAAKRAHALALVSEAAVLLRAIEDIQATVEPVWGRSANTPASLYPVQERMNSLFG